MLLVDKNTKKQNLRKLLEYLTEYKNNKQIVNYNDIDNNHYIQNISLSFDTCDVIDGINNFELIDIDTKSLWPLGIEKVQIKNFFPDNKKGEAKALNFIMGKVMQKTRGKATPKEVNDIILKLIK
jgi:Glu-tRNA(Gln) amidotransferase subunit E-like FAD-binding protein